LAIRENALGPDHPDVATSLNNLGFLYDAQGQYAQGEPLYERSLAIDEKALGPDHPKVATGLENMAALYRATERGKEAAELEQRAAEIRAIRR
jgi:tetratricopeptide (TPR) repeat protein